ncbi:MAG TPA: peptidoglycan DD-metalloendopeptidase family protein [Clostridiales bacterium]|nr:peptidoglycan DD-metalloendopeptidase family protein [Clostridiales bacterium]
MVTVPDKPKILLPPYRQYRLKAYARRRPSRRIKVNFAALRVVTYVIFHLALVAAIALYIHTLMGSDIAVTAYVNGHKIASVSNPAVIREAVYTLTLDSTNLSADFADGKLPPMVKVPRFNFDLDYRFSLIGAFGAQGLSSVRVCTEKLFDIVRESYAYAFVVFVDDVPVAATERYSDAEEAVEKVERLLDDATIGNGEDVDQVRICSSIKVQYGLCERAKILTPEGLYSKLERLLDIDIPEYSVAAKNTTPVNYAIDYGINRVITVNGTPVMASSVPAIQTENIIIETETYPIDYKTRYVESDEHYVGETFVLTKGSAGLQLVTYDLVMENGEVIERRIASRETIVRPTDEVIVVGTRPLPPAVPTGSFSFPVALPYTITSDFGVKRAEFDGDAYHFGVDFAGKKGDPVYAADGGTVVYAGYSPSYGLMIKIDHGNGLTTVYAHCSKLLLDVGDKVYKGQLIAHVGDTGTTTGTHLHFEIRKNGVYQDPLKHLEK